MTNDISQPKSETQSTFQKALTAFLVGALAGSFYWWLVTGLLGSILKEVMTFGYSVGEGMKITEANKPYELGIELACYVLLPLIVQVVMTWGTKMSTLQKTAGCVGLVLTTVTYTTWLLHEEGGRVISIRLVFVFCAVMGLLPYLTEAISVLIQSCLPKVSRA